MKRFYASFFQTGRHIIVVVACLCTFACVEAKAADEIVFPAAGNQGVFDPSLARGRGRRIWMSYSTVETTTVQGAVFDAVGTRLAFSDDRGASWSDLGVAVNVAQAEPHPPSEFAGKPALWQHEVSSLVYEPRAPIAERWKLLWFRYLQVDDGIAGNDDRKPAYSWIALKAAASPDALASATERKLFTGLGYHLTPAIEAYNDAIIGPPEEHLEQLDPALGGCIAFTEPGAIVKRDAMYVSLSCAAINANGSKIVLVKRPIGSGIWQYLGAALDAATAKALEPTYTAFSAPDLYQVGRSIFLIATPTVAPFNWYGGCLVFRFRDVETASLLDVNYDSLPDVLVQVGGTPGSFNGACSYTPRSRDSGVIFSQAFLGQSPVFRMFKSGLNPRRSPLR